MAIGAIASKAKASARLFDELCYLPETDLTARTVLLDQSSRFQIWAANIGALQEPPLPSSLDHRLREAPRIADQIKELLDDLIEALQEILPIVLGDVTNRIGSVDSLFSESRALNDADRDAASVSSDQSQPLSELEELLKSCSDTVTSLFRSSVLIRSATTRDRYAKAAAAQGKPFDPRFDVDHVEHKFPRLNQADWLKKRLGIANTQRRQYLRYCREHRQRMGTEKRSVEADGGATQDDRMTRKDGHQDSVRQSSKSYVSSRPPSTLAMTNASTLNVAALRSLDEISDEAQSQTSYATSLGADEDSVYLRVPTVPESAKSGLPFECHYCWTIQTVANSRTWKKHVFQDLRPYICTFEGCDLKVFADRSSWFNHELQAHRVEWCCPFCPLPPFQSLKSFEGHLASRHTSLFSKDHLEPLTEACKQSVNSISPHDCPFCEEWSTDLENINPGLTNLVVTLAQFQHHVGSHMEQLALFALPRNLDKEDTSADAVAGHDSHSDSDMGSHASYDDQDNPPLHTAAYEGLEEEILQLLQDGSDIEAPGQTWGNVLTAAIIGGQTSIVRLLLDHGAKVDGHAGPFGLPLQAAAQKGDDASIQLLRDAGALDVATGTSNDGSHSNERVDVEGRITSVQQLIATVCSYLNDIRDTQRVSEVRNRLHSELSDVNRMLFMLRDWATEAHQADPSYIYPRLVDGSGELEQFAVELAQFASRTVPSEGLKSVNTVMTWQIQKADVKALLDSAESLKSLIVGIHHLVGISDKDVAAMTFNDGAESDKHGRTLLVRACAQGDVENVKEQLFENPKATNVPDDLGDLPLHHAAINGHMEVARLMLEAGCDVNCKNNQGMRPLHDAAAKGYTEIVQLLLNVSGCNVDCLNRDKDTPLHQAVKYGRAGVVQQLISAGAHVDCQNRKGSTPLHLAAKAGHVSIARSLIEAKADANLRNNNGDSPLHLTYQRANSDLRSLLASATTDPTINDQMRQITESVRNTPSELAPALQKLLDRSDTLDEARIPTLMAISRHENGPYDVDGAIKAIEVVLEESYVAWTEVCEWARTHAFVGEPEENEVFQSTRRCLDSKVFNMSALHRSLILLDLQSPCPISFIDRLGLRATTVILALDELIIGLDRSVNKEWILVTCRTHLLLVDTLKTTVVFKSKLGWDRDFVEESQSPPRRLGVSPRHRTRIESETKAPMTFSLARFNVDMKNSVIRSVAGPFEVTWDLEKVLADQKFAYTIKRHEGKFKATDFKGDGDEEVGGSLMDEGDVVVKQVSKSRERVAKKLMNHRERIVYETVIAGWLARAASLEHSPALDEHLTKIESMLQQLEEEGAYLKMAVD